MKLFYCTKSQLLENIDTKILKKKIKYLTNFKPTKKNKFYYTMILNKG